MDYLINLRRSRDGTFVRSCSRTYGRPPSDSFIQKQQREARSDCPETSNLSQAFTTDVIINALKATKAGKVAGPDGIFPDMLKNIWPAAVRWLQAFYDDVMTTATIPKIWRSANVTAIRKPGKPIDEPTSHRPISLLCWSTWALRMTPSGRLISLWIYQKPPSAEQQSDSSPALLASEPFGYSSATKSAESVSWRTVFPKDPYLRRRSSTYTSVTSLQPSRWSLDMLVTGPLPHNQRHLHTLRVHSHVISDTWTSTLTTGSCA